MKGKEKGGDKGEEGENSDEINSRASSRSKISLANDIGGKFGKSSLVFFIQVFVLIIVAGTSIVNLLIKKDDENSKLWIILLSSAVGILLPAPSLKLPDIIFKE